MKALALIAGVSIIAGLAGCQSAELARVAVQLDTQRETLARIEQQTPELLRQIQARENTIKTLESEVMALSQEQAELHCLILSQRVHVRCISEFSTLTDHAMYSHRVERCARLDPLYHANPADCKRRSTEP